MYLTEKYGFVCEKLELPAIKPGSDSKRANALEYLNQNDQLIGGLKSSHEILLLKLSAK